MDVFNRVKYDESFEYVLKDPATGEDTDVVFYLRSSGNPDAKALDLKYLNAVKSSNVSKKSIPIEHDLDYAYDKLATSITGWNDKLVFGGEPLKYNKEAVDKIVRIDWLFDQLNKFVSDVENFMK